jgi:hypothetical protein
LNETLSETAPMHEPSPVSAIPENDFRLGDVDWYDVAR